MKNICFLNTTNFWGGGEKLHFEYALKFIKKNYNVYIVTSKISPLHKKAVENKIKCFNINLNNFSFLNIFKYIKLYRFFKDENIDTVFFSSSPDLKTGSISAKIAKVKNVIYLRGLAIPVKNTFLNRKLFKNFISDIIVNSEETKRTVLANLSKSLNIENKIIVIYHGIDLEHNNNINSDNNYFISKDSVIIGNAGRLTNQKGQKDLIQIALKLKERGLNFKILIAGTGELKEELNHLIEINNLQNNVLLLGFVEDMKLFMNSLDIFILTSSWEGFGYVIVEAMAAYKPVVAYNITSNPEIVKDNETGFLADYHDIDMIVEKLEILIKDEELRKIFGNNGRKYVENNFVLDNKITEIEKYLKNKSKLK